MKLLSRTFVLLLLTSISVACKSDRREIKISPDDQRVPPTDTPNDEQQVEPLPELDPEIFPPLDEVEPEVPEESLLLGAWVSDCIGSVTEDGYYYQAKIVFTEQKMQEVSTAYSDETSTSLVATEEPQSVESDYSLGVEITTFENAWEIDVTRIEEGQEYLAVVIEEGEMLISRICDQQIGNVCVRGSGLSSQSRSLDFTDSIKYTKVEP